MHFSWISYFSIDYGDLKFPSITSRRCQCVIPLSDLRVNCIWPSCYQTVISGDGSWYRTKWDCARTGHVSYSIFEGIICTLCTKNGYLARGTSDTRISRWIVVERIKCAKINVAA
jgi:hypothetical protein